MSPDTRVFNAVIVDDEPAARAVIAQFRGEEPRIAVCGEAGNGDAAVRLIKEVRPDLVFLDVQMPDRDGFGVLEALHDEVPPGVVFVTAYDEHALRAFEVHALDYILKPFGRPRFQAALQRAIRRLEAEDAWSLRRTLAGLVNDRLAPASNAVLAGSEAAATARPVTRLAVRSNERIVIVNVQDVDWVEADRDYVRLHVRGKVHLLADRMHAIEARLDAQQFLRIHRSTIVNLLRVRELRRAEDGGGLVILEDGVGLRVARNRWSTLERVLQLASR